MFYRDKKQGTKNPKDYTLENLKGEKIIKKPGSIEGEQFIIQNCEECEISVLDYTNSVTIDDCVNCKIILGPIKGSVFIRNCKDSNFIISCQQFRIRDCWNLNVFLSVATQPIIEASTKIKIGCYRFSYADLEDQFIKAGLSSFNNSWYDICDFTPKEDGSNWSLIPKDVDIGEYFILPSTDSNLQCEFTHLVVPYTFGLQEKSSEESTFIMLFSDGHTHYRALSFIREMETNHPNIKLLRTKEVKFTIEDIHRVLKTSSYNLVVERGPVIGMEYNGEGCIAIGVKTAMNIATSSGSTGLLYVSNNAKSSAAQIKEFFIS
ncbi:Protein Xrp2, variant 3 [Chamberlinius hualienensis]